MNQASKDALVAFERQLEILAERGFVVKRIRAFDDIVRVAERHQRMIAGEMARVHERWFSRYESRYRPETAALIREGRKVGMREVRSARSGRRKLRVELESLMEKNKLDLWAPPAATGFAPKGLSSTGDPAMNLPWTYAGLPAITVPTCRGANQLPLGLQLVASFMGDELLLSWAEAIADVVGERATPDEEGAR